MQTRPSRFGVGPKLALALISTTLAAGYAVWRWPGVCVIDWLPEGLCRLAGSVPAVAGALLWASSVLTVQLAYNRDELLTRGAFALVRHPVYASWISLILPGAAIYFRAWPLLVPPLAAYAVFKRLIHVEDDYLKQRFGQAYLDYRARVNEILPIPRLR